ncbi:MAG: DEAD/DEAH box helicase family protein [Candidatus Vogelbacteria bacterium]|nr:DEAD/DEAH box helicase family protein [Candidatus Vogelbacteria bacterium]
MSAKKLQTFYDSVRQDQQYKIAVGSPSPKTIENYDKIQHLLKFALRPYQVEALSAFQLFWKDGFDSRSLKQKTAQSEKNDEGKDVLWNKVGFEMATGSGKTLLMGATILDLWHRGYKDFLILTPNTILFDKTIENFTPRAVKSIFGDGWNLTYNLVTGNSYRDKTCNWEEDRDISFYVFNMQKFYDKVASSAQKDGEDTMKGVPYVRRPLEDSLWRDKTGQHTISFVEFLRERRPVIISDEAHHYQQKKTTEAIFELLPRAVLEFTATSLEKGGESESFGQNNLYKYPMQRYINEGYGKRIFAVGCGTSDEKTTDEVSESDKQKLVWGILIHLLKWEALAAVNAPVKKAMLLTKARSINHADAINDYLKNWPDSVSGELDDVLEQVNREGTDIAKIVRQNIPKNKTELIKKMSAVAKSVFTIHSENKSDEEIWTEYQSLDDNKAEIVNQVRIFSEGVDYDNFYTIVVLGDTVEKVGLAAAQLIGRGLRLYKEKREFDILGNELKEQSEILHVVCERGRRFDKIVEEIRENLELSPASIEIPTEEEERENKVNRKIIDDYEIPILQIKPIATGKSFEEALKNKSLSVRAFIDEVCGVSRGEKVLKPEVLNMVDYAEITSEEIELQKDKPTTTRRSITLSKGEIARWALDFIEQTGPSIGNNSFDTARKLIEEIVSSGIQVDTAYAIDYKRALKALEKSIIEFYGRKSYELMFKSEFNFKNKNVKNIFIDNKVTIRKRLKWTNLYPAYQDLPSTYQAKGVVVEGYKYSIRPYVKLDSQPEKWVADTLEHLCSLDKTKKSFWVRNEPRTEYPVEVKPAPFYPDFLAFINGKWIVVDVKGKHLAEAKQIDDRKKALKLLEKEGGVQTFFLVDKVMEKRGFKAVEIASVSDLEGFDELRHEELGLEEFTNGATPTLFDKKKMK